MKIQVLEDGKFVSKTISKDDIGLGNVDNTSDLDKPISNAVNSALLSIQNNINALQDVLDLGDISGAVNIDLSYSAIKFNLTGNATFTFTNPPASGVNRPTTFYGTRTSGSNAVLIFTQSVSWVGSKVAPSILDVQTTVFSVSTINAGTSYFGFANGLVIETTASGQATTWNPSDKEAAVTLTNGNRTFEVTSGRGGVGVPLYSSVRGFGGKNTGKWRLASRIDTVLSAGNGRLAEYSLGITSGLMLLTQGAGTLNSSYAINLLCSGSSNTTTLRSLIENVITSKASFVANPNLVAGVLGLLVNLNTGKGWLTYNNIVLNTGGNPEADTNPDFLIDSGVIYFPCASIAEYGPTGPGSGGIHTILNEVQDIYQPVWPSFTTWTA